MKYCTVIIYNGLRKINSYNHIMRCEIIGDIFAKCFRPLSYLGSFKMKFKLIFF